MNIFSDSFKKEAPLLGLQGSGGGLGYLTGGTSAAGPLYVDDVFSTYLYDGNNSTQTITNGIDLAGKGGFVWIKRRGDADPSNLYDTERDVNKLLRTTSTGPQVTNQSDLLTSFNASGFTIGADSGGFGTNPSPSSTSTMVSWTFRKAPGFFTIKKWTGNGQGDRYLDHDLGSVPGFVIVKNLTNHGDWGCYHRSLGTGIYDGLFLNHSYNSGSNNIRNPIRATPTDTQIYVRGGAGGDEYNDYNNDYVAYLFAHDEQSFGTNEDEAIIKCGTYPGTASAGNFVNLGFEPQFLIIKNTTTSTGRWFMLDMMRGLSDSTNGTAYVAANLSTQENDTTAFVPRPNGFVVNSTGAESNANGSTYAYIAIRRPHKPPSTGTDVFMPLATRGATDGTPSNLAFTSNFPVDLLLYTQRNGGANSHAVIDRMRGGTKLLATSSGAIDATTDHKFDSNDGVYLGSTLSANSTYGGLLFRRAPGFMDILTYPGTGSVKTENHNLTVVPEMMWIKKRGTGTGHWQVYHSSKGNTYYAPSFRTDPFYLSSSRWNNTSPTSTQFTLGLDNDVNQNGHTYVAYLFATLPGISKVGSYPGTGNSQDIDCGFTNGARFVLIKRADSEIQGSAPDRTNWYLWDSARGSGIVTGDDPWIALNESTAEVTNTDYIDPLNAGFTVSSTGTGLNAVGGTYIYLAIA